VLIEPGFVATDIVDASTRERGEVAVAPGADGEVYGPLIDGADKFMTKQMKQAMPASALARTIANVAEARRPRTRYVVPIGAKGLVAIFTRLPDRLADAVKRRAMAG
jgi:hypothetical protein